MDSFILFAEKGDRQELQKGEASFQRTSEEDSNKSVKEGLELYFEMMSIRKT